MFTSLLEPENPPTTFSQATCRGSKDLDHEEGWWGGTAVITSVAGAAPSLYMAIVFNGIFPKTVNTSDLVRVILTLPDKNQTIIDQVIVLSDRVVWLVHISWRYPFKDRS